MQISMGGTGLLRLVAGLLLIGGATAQADEAAVQRHIRELEERIDGLEASKTPAIGVSGLIEVEAAAGEDHTAAEGSDITLATLALGFEAQPDEWVNVYVGLLHEDDATEPMEVDEAILTLGNGEVSPFYLAVGRLYIPFGGFATHMLSDPLTLELAETRAAAVQLGLESVSLAASVYAFNGEGLKAGEDEAVEHFGAHLGYAWGGERAALALGVGYLSSLAESSLLQEGVSALDALDGYTAAHTVQLDYRQGAFNLIAEYVSAAERFAAADLAFVGDGARPAAWNLELAYSFELLGREAGIALGRQGSEEASALGLPERKSLAALSMGLTDSAALGFEYALAEDYSTADGGTGEEGAAFTVQLAVEF